MVKAVNRVWRSPEGLRHTLFTAFTMR